MIYLLFMWNTSKLAGVSFHVMSHLKLRVLHDKLVLYCIVLYWVYYELTTRSVPSWLDSSVGRALHGYRRGHGFKSHSGLNVFSGFNFTTAKVVCITVMINHIIK